LRNADEFPLVPLESTSTVSKKGTVWHKNPDLDFHQGTQFDKQSTSRSRNFLIFSNEIDKTNRSYGKSIFVGREQNLVQFLTPSSHHLPPLLLLLLLLRAQDVQNALLRPLVFVYVVYHFLCDHDHNDRGQSSSVSQADTLMWFLSR